MRPTSVEILEPQAGPTVSLAGNTYRTLLSGTQTGGAYAVIDMLVPPGGGPAPHAHAEVQENFFVIEGEVVVRSDTQTYTAGVGTFINIAKGGAVHNFKNESEAVAHLLCIVAPAGTEEMFAEAGQPVAPGTFLPPPRLEPADIARLQGIARRYGQEVFAPTYFDQPTR
ncbi:cupin domain-containing protein [Hymenobacter properus]|uniref:Cupin domain-containing protein n=1 Tax=Hymenobacter properus TaxID=2791026 RepID=A0A931BK88_9BACT|nr:cupin domain-containing protein [Hymenobacter properus]MBF9141798.1 cupin domain-containing protein [Hymenobacter properus]MBR7720606.1 cupin domain-containing protein [Microvirga sp. SRT04]